MSCDKYDKIMQLAINNNINQAQYSTKEQLEILLIIGNKYVDCMMQ